MKMKKIAVWALIGIIGIRAMPFTSYAADQVGANAAVTDESGVQILSTDKIVTKYRVYDGKWQYRRWNETKECWVDPHWIDM